MTIGRICTRVVASASQQESVRIAAQRMAANEVGTVVVLSAHGSRPVGMLTDRDIAVRCVAGNLDPDRTEIAAIMTRPVQSADEDTPIEDAVERMARIGARRLVVTGPGGELAGVLSLDDVLDLLAKEAGSIAHLLSKQQTHVPA